MERSSRKRSSGILRTCSTRPSSPRRNGAAAFGTGTAEGAGGGALRKCGTNLVAQPGLLTLYPGGYAPFSEDVTCPVFVATGDGDLSPRSRAPILRTRYKNRWTYYCDTQV